MASRNVGQLKPASPGTRFPKRTLKRLLQLGMALFVALCVPNKAPAQSISLPQITDVNGSLQGAMFVGRNAWNKDGPAVAPGFGFEVSFDPIPLDPENIPANYVRKKDRNWITELYLGYSQLFLNMGVAGDMELRGALRALPSLGIYVNRNRGWLEGLYFGLGSGVVQIVNGRAYDSAGQIYEVSGDTFLLSGAIGFNYHHVFVEFSGHLRYFPSLGYKLPTGVATLPEGLPRAVSLSGFNLSIGYQLEMNPVKAK